MADACKGCGTERPKRRQWYYRYADLPITTREIQPIEMWCPACAPADLREARVAMKLANLKGGERRHDVR